MKSRISSKPHGKIYVFLPMTSLYKTANSNLELLDPEVHHAVLRSRGINLKEKHHKPWSPNMVPNFILAHGLISATSNLLSHLWRPDQCNKSYIICVRDSYFQD